MGLPASDCQHVSVGATGALPGGLNKVRRIGGEGAPAALRGDYGGQRERSRITRAAVPCCTAPDGPSCRSSADTGRQVVLCVRPLWWTASCPRRGRRRWSTSPAQAQRGLTGGPAPVVRPLCCVGRSVLQSPAHAGSQVFALLPRG